MTTYYHFLNSPIDPLLLVSDGDALTGLYMDAHKYGPERRDDWENNRNLFTAAIEQLRAYFGGELQDFDLPLRMNGTVFQRGVWGALCTIPFGQTVSYKMLAEQIDSPKAVRAVGLANGKNPVSIIVPCHRVIGANGKLVGYGGGLNRKHWLLTHEAEHDNSRLL